MKNEAMSQKSSGSGQFIFGWLEVLDQLNYYELFEIPPDAASDQVRSAFHRFVDTFHPDRHVARSPDEREALLSIFKRGTEAYLILCDPRLRADYDGQIVSGVHNRPTGLGHTARSRPPSTPASGDAPPSLEESARSPSSRPFARRADELIHGGDLRQAK